ncbi:MAG: hypothetical protein KDC85_02355 [Saprospiraceae bacterium]|nr:hypothetical protein [Saprospiraceae bacterium]MCB9323788.1 hypothetical protein [Lewinellaceae bacterium]
MKNLIITTLLTLFGYVSLWSQSDYMTSYDVVESPESMGAAPHNAYLLNIDADQKLTLDSWASQMDNKGFKTYIVNTSQPVLLTEDALLPKICPEKLDIYIQSQYNGQNDGTNLTFWFVLPNGEFLSSQNHPESFDAVSRFLFDFCLQAKKNLKTSIHYENLQIVKNRYPATSPPKNKKGDL